MMKPDLAAQRDQIQRLADLATWRKIEKRRHRESIRKWKRDTFGRLDTLAWIYAAGVTWGISRADDDEHTRPKRGKTLRVLNTALVASRLFGSVAAASEASDAAAV
ncbi:MAG: hypothetical protein R3315_04940 [Woeseiaceae bacterium]|nr:hypothetical protein [Woeseiaceae bacterium]